MTLLKQANLNFRNQLNPAGRMRTSNQRSQLAFLQAKEKSTSFSEETSGGSETSTYEADGAGSVNMGVTASGEYVIRQSKEWAYYYPGKPLKVELTASNFDNEANITKRIGYFSSSTAAPYTANLDGFFFESDGTDHYVCIYRNGTQVLKVGTSSWLNQSEIANWDPADFNFYVIEFLYLGGAVAEFSVLTEFGLTKVYSYQHINVDNNVFVKSPNQPVRYEIRSGAAAAGTLNHICSDVATEGDREDEISNAHSYSLGSNLIAGLQEDVRYALIGLRLKSTAREVVADVYGLSVLSASADQLLVEIYDGGTLAANDSGVGFVDDANSSLSILDGYDVQVAGNIADLVHTGGKPLLGFLMSGNSDKDSILENARRLGSELDGTMNELYVCVTPITNNASATLVKNWKEFI